MPKQGNPFINVLTRDLLALFGAHDLNNPFETFRTSLPPQKIRVHRDWNPNLESYDADIAIITLQAGAITFSSFVQPICLWNKKTDPTQTEGHISGWGQSENLEKFWEEIPTKLKVSIHTNEFCLLTAKDLVDLASNRTFCAGRGDGTGICDGDSGGGLSIKVGSTFYFRGIVSSSLYDETGCDVTKFAIFTDVLKFKPWIDQIMRQDGEFRIQATLRCTVRPHVWYDSVEDKIEDLQTCLIFNQTIDGGRFSVAGDPNPSIQAFYILQNKEVKFLPEDIAKIFPELISCEVWDCSIRTVHEEHFKGLHKLKHLNLGRNEIESINGDSFKDLKELGFLGLSHNKIKTIDPNLLQSLEALRSFGIDYNQIEFLDEQIFDNLRNLKSIRLDYNKLSTIPADLFKNNLKLELIWLNENKIQTISSTMFDHLKNLTSLGLRNNDCVNDFYGSKQFNEMKNVLSRNCRSPV